jgi:chloramphenicol 3-O phosphotransferase
LQDRLDAPYLHCPIDLFEQMIPYNQVERGVPIDFMVVQSGFSACIAALAGAGNHIIVDDVICEPFGERGEQGVAMRRALLQQRVRMLQGLTVLYVKVYCPLLVIEQRERLRGNRTIGLARFQYDRVHQDSIYDVEVDTSLHSPEACAEHILAALFQSQPPRAFRSMGSLFDGQIGE